VPHSIDVSVRQLALVWWNQHSTSGRGTRNIIAAQYPQYFGETEKIQDGKRASVKPIAQSESRAHSDSRSINCEVNSVASKITFVWINRNINAA